MEVQNHSSPKYINLVGVETKTEEISVVGSETICIGDAQHITKILEGDIRITLVGEEILEVVRDIEVITITMEGTIIEVKVMIGTEVDH